MNSTLCCASVRLIAAAVSASSSPSRTPSMRAPMFSLSFTTRRSLLMSVPSTRCRCRRLSTRQFIRYCTQMATSAATVAISSKPMGKDEVVAAVLEAASELFAEKGPAATSIREVAARAGVNHGLLHRHFGSKRQLLAATLQYLADSAAALRESGASQAEVETTYEFQARVMVRSTLDGFPVEELQQRFPGMEAFLDQVRAGHTDDRTARLLAAHGMALQVGWGLMGPTLRVAFGLQDLDDNEIRTAVAEQIAKIVAEQ